MSLLCRMSGETILTDTGPPKSAAALTASAAEPASRAGTTGMPASPSSARASCSDHFPRRRAGSGTGTGADGTWVSGLRVASDHQATLRSATTAWRSPGMTYGTPPCSIDARV